MEHSTLALPTLRRRFAGLAPSGAKDIGLRRVRDAMRYGARPEMAAHVAQLTAEAVYQLPYAEAISARRRAAA
jgi:hypothetical protein